jgi:cobalamin biosynthesis protein CobD/CbiB
MLTPLTAMLVGTFVVLKRQRLTAKSILRLACLQPRGWRFWYPKAFRRRGDVWDRLPTPMRRSRMQFAAGFCAVVFVAVPIQLGLFLTRRPSAVSNAAGIFVLSYLLFMFTKRRRVTTYVAKAVNITREEASRIVSLASWRTTAWHTGPAAALLRATDAANTTASALAETTPTVFVASRPDRSNDVTRL